MSRGTKSRRLRVKGHLATQQKLGPSDARQRCKDGWGINCICGWSANGATRREIEHAYTQHLQQSMPVCSRCLKTTPPHRMSTHSPNMCKPCNQDRLRQWKIDHPKEWERHARKHWLRTRYNLTTNQYDQMVAAQNNRCPICLVCFSDLHDSRGFRPHVDHCHATGKARGILCGSCNRGLGNFRDDPAVLERALLYLLQHSVLSEVS